MKTRNLRLSLGLAALLALVLTSLTSAHPSLYNVVGKVAKSPEIQTITIDATGGTFKPSANGKSVPFNAPAWQVQDALGADLDIGRTASGQANVLVTGADGGPYTLRYQGSRATTDQAQVVPDASGLTGGASTAIAATVVEGGQADIRYQDDPTGASLPDDVLRTAIANDGYAMTFVESNGLATNGWLNLRFMPGGYRRPAAPGIPMTQSQWVNWPLAQTTIQSHATCQGVAALNTEANILAVQSNANDPFWNYVPWQKTSAQLGDEPEQWTGVVQAATGVDLNALNTVDEFRTACEGEGGVYVPADNPSFPANGAIADAVAAAVAPLNAMIADLEDQIDALTDRPLRVQLQAKRQNDKVVAMVTGPLNTATTVRLRIGPALANQLGLASRVLAVKTLGFGARGAVLVTLAPNTRAANAIARRGGFVAVEVRASAAGANASVNGSLRT